MPGWAKIRQFKAKTARDWLTFGVGAAGLILQTLSNGLEKPTLIIAFVGMMGLPIFLHKDEADAKLAPTPIPPPPPPVVPVPPVAAPAAPVPEVVP